jgi:hypothetical protein
MNDKPHPYIIAALLCEKVLQEADGSLSIIRIADRVQLQMEGPPGLQMSPALNDAAIPLFQLSCLIAIRSGPATGKHILQLSLKTPAGITKGQPVQQEMNLLGKDHGQNFIVNFVIGAEEEGLHWVHVDWDEGELTRIPLMVVRTPVRPGQP